jgi:hypothetical protein
MLFPEARIPLGGVLFSGEGHHSATHLLGACRVLEQVVGYRGVGSGRSGSLGRVLPTPDDGSTFTSVTGFLGDTLDDEAVIAVLVRSTFGFQKGYLKELSGLTLIQILFIYFADVNVASNHVMLCCVVYESCNSAGSNLQ